MLVLVGPSGCGKTTTLRMIAGLESITSGTLKIGDRVVNDVAPNDRDIAMVFQNYALYPHMTVAENLGFGLKLRGESQGDHRRAREGIGRTARTRCLSAIACRARCRADSASASRSDARWCGIRRFSCSTSRCRISMRNCACPCAQEIARLHRNVQTTMIYVTHDQIEAMTLGQRIVVIKTGEIQQIDTPMNLYTKPQNVFVAGFLGSPAMNFFRGKLVRADGLQLQMQRRTLPLGTPPGLDAYIGKQLIAGIRPESLRVSPGDPLHIDAQLDVLEPVGNEVFLHLTWNGNGIVVREPMQELPARGSMLTLNYATSSLHFFDAQTEKRIDAP